MNDDSVAVLSTTGPYSMHPKQTRTRSKARSQRIYVRQVLLASLAIPGERSQRFVAAAAYTS
jgi:hypothetical protein